MKSLNIFVVLGMISPLIWGQTASTMDAQSRAAERTRIAAQRQQQTEVFDQEDRACLTRFVVTACRDEVAARRRLVMADLRRQELAINEAERKEAGREKLEHLKEKAAQNAANKAAQVPAPAAPITPPAPHEPVRSPLTTNTAQGGASAPARSVDAVDPAVLAERRRAYEAKQADLVRRRQERDKRLQTPSKPGLPTPP